jgi:hypothetical protein
MAWLSLCEATVPAVDRAARCFVEESAAPDPFWDTMHGPIDDSGWTGCAWWWGNSELDYDYE